MMANRYIYYDNDWYYAENDELKNRISLSWHYHFNGYGRPMYGRPMNKSICDALATDSLMHNERMYKVIEYDRL